MILTACRVCRLWKHFMWLFCNFWHVHKHTQIAYTAESDLNLRSYNSLSGNYKVDNCLDGDFMRKKEHFYAILCPKFENTNTSCFTWKILKSLNQGMVHKLWHLSKNGFKETNHTFDGHLYGLPLFFTSESKIKNDMDVTSDFDMYVQIFNM